MPEVSIITINLNNLPGLQKTVESVISQEFKDFEYLLIDGGSSDGSKEYILANQSKFSYWISEKDNGLYQAMNKGIIKSKGNYLLFLNSGDFLFNEYSLKKLTENIKDHDLIFGDLLIVEKSREWRKNFPDSLSFGYFLVDSLPHPATLIKREVFDKTGFYNEELKIVADWEIFTNAICKWNSSYHHVKEIITAFQYDGLSSTEENMKLIFEERHHVLETQFSAWYTDYLEAEKVKNRLISLQNSRWMKLKNLIRKILFLK